MAASDDEPSSLTSVAESLEGELARLEEVVKETERVEISSDKSLQRARRLLEQCSERQLRIAGHLTALAVAVNSSQGRVKTSMDDTLELSRRIGARAAERGALVERFAALGSRTQEISGPLAAIMAKQQEGVPPEELLAAIGEILGGADRLAVEADAIARDARAGGWVDVTREADALRQQILAARNKLLVLQRGLSERTLS